MTAQDLINSTARALGILGTGEVLSSNEASDALTALNMMIDRWATKGLLVYSNVEELFSLVAGQQSYTMGTGGNFNTTRAQKINNAYIRTVNGSTNFDLKLDIANQDQWANIGVKNIQSKLPTTLFSEGTYPLDTILFWPIPSAAISVGIWSWKSMASFAALTSTVSLPPGYQEAIKWNLALVIAPEYGLSPSELIVAQADESMADIKRMNIKPNYLSVDEALISDNGTFNWLTGGFR